MTVLALVAVFLPIIFAKLSDERGYYNLALALAYVPFFFGEKLRYYFYRYTLAKCGSKIMFKFGSCCLYRDIELYNNITIGLFTTIGKCTIEENVLLGSHVNITSGNQQHIATMNEGDAVLTDGKRERVTISKNVWVGNNAVIFKNIARNCIIGAGAVVTRPTEKNGVYVGNPAQRLRDIDAI
ncbi:MAG: acyltransferase [Sulfurovaceae bacterium]